MKRTIWLVALIALLLAGCAKKDIVGKWKVDPTLVSGAPGQDQGFLTGFASTFTYEFKSDKTFKGSMSEGTYTFDGKNVSVSTTKLMGQDISQFGASGKVPQMTGELSDDGKTLTLHPPSSQMLPDALKNGVRMVRDSS